MLNRTELKGIISKWEMYFSYIVMAIKCKFSTILSNNMQFLIVMIYFVAEIKSKQLNFVRVCKSMIYFSTRSFVAPHHSTNNK